MRTDWLAPASVRHGLLLSSPSRMPPAASRTRQIDFGMNSSLSKLRARSPPATSSALCSHTRCLLARLDDVGGDFLHVESLQFSKGTRHVEE